MACGERFCALPQALIVCLYLVHTRCSSRLLFCTHTPKGSQPQSNTSRFCPFSHICTCRLPVAHTCFNQVCLFGYTSKSMLQDKLVQAITESDGFDLA